MQNTKEIIEFSPIGIIHTPHTKSVETPIQPVFAKGIAGTVNVFPEFTEGLSDINEFSHIILLYYFDRSTQTKLKVKPYLEDELRGVFSTRAPHRPNKIGMSVVRLKKIEQNILHVEDVDMLDGTPLIDIKPYIARFDLREDIRSGWQDHISDKEASKKGKRGYKKGNNQE
jgi:tRNA (adenine37-N6)-methyltransferase